MPTNYEMNIKHFFWDVNWEVINQNECKHLFFRDGITLNFPLQENWFEASISVIVEKSIPINEIWQGTVMILTAI